MHAHIKKGTRPDKAHWVGELGPAPGEELVVKAHVLVLTQMEEFKQVLSGEGGNGKDSILKGMETRRGTYAWMEAWQFDREERRTKLNFNGQNISR